MLLQPVGDHDLPAIENEIREIKRLTAQPFRLIAVKVERWNDDLSPWCAPAVFGHEDFGDGAAALLREILPLCEDADRRYIIGGYSMAGLFALYAIYQTGLFSRVGSISGSLWFPGMKEYIFSHEPTCWPGCMYFSLGDKESKTRNQVLRNVRQNTDEIHAFYRGKGIDTTFQLNPGNHYNQAVERTVDGLCWLLSR